MTEHISHRHISEDDIKEAERIEMSEETIMRLVDLIFLCKDEHNEIPS